MSKLVTASSNHDLDELLDLTCVEIQLTKTQFDRAGTSYGAVGDWLGAINSPLHQYWPDIFPQGSLRIGTTVRPLSQAEFDLDLVCLLRLWGVPPMVVYNLLLERLASHGRYAPIISPERRCIRLEYAGDFHLDVVPAIPDPDAPPGSTSILIPDRERRVWRPSNPKGYAGWFEENAKKRLLVEKAAQLSANARIEPLSAPAPAYTKPPLKLAVQLMKRWRDVAFNGRMHLAPSSIVLTTLAAELYRGEDHPTEALMSILNGIRVRVIHGPIRLRNPSNPKESITDRWEADPDMYNAFVAEVLDFRVRWEKLVTAGRFPDMSAELKALFGEVPVNRAFTKFAERRTEARAAGRLASDRTTGVLSITPVSIPAAAAVRVKDHTFHGED